MLELKDNQIKKALIRGTYLTTRNKGCSGCPLNVSGDELMQLTIGMDGICSIYRGATRCTEVRVKLQGKTCMQVAAYVLAKNIEKELNL